MARVGRKYLILDTETCTLPFADQIARSVKEKRTIAIAKPLIYDIAWKVIDRNGKVYSRHSYLVSETFNVPSVFNTAYYKDKRPKYIERLEKGEIEVKQWEEIVEILQEDLKGVAFVGAFNSMFDYKKAIPFTEKYMSALRSRDYYKWEKEQKFRCQRMLVEKSNYKNPDWDGMNFEFRGEKYPLIDLWGIACESLINTQTYKRKCLQHSMITESGLFFKSSAETTFRYLCDKYDFEEMHMAIDDVNIECEILLKALKKGKITEGLQYFPFQMLGKTSSFILNDKTKRTIPVKEVGNVIEIIEEKLKEYKVESGFATNLERTLGKLIDYLNKRHGETAHGYALRGIELEIKDIDRQINKARIDIKKLKSDKAIAGRYEKIDNLTEQKYRLMDKARDIQDTLITIREQMNRIKDY